MQGSNSRNYILQQKLDTALGALAAFVKFVSPWIKGKLKDWWNKTRTKTEFTLGYKAELVGSETSSPEYEIGYLFISYETTYKRKWTDWKFRTSHSFYGLSLIGKLPKFREIANERSINNAIKFDRKRRKIGEGADSYIYRNINSLAFYPIKQFTQVPNWANLPYIEQQIRTYFKSYETYKQNQYDIRNGNKWLKCEELAEGKWLGIARKNVKHNQDPLMSEPKKIKRLLEKGVKKQFETYKIGEIVCIRRRTGD